MMNYEQIRELALFQAAPEQYALSFYFQPQTPQSKSHREESILAKDLVREAIRNLNGAGKQAAIRADLERVLDLAGKLHGNQARAKAVFASGASGFWREFDLPARLTRTQLLVKPRFHLKPLAVLLGAQPRLGVALVDRRRARFFDLRLDELTEKEALFGAQSHRGRSDGFAGYQGGNAERSVANEALTHFKNVAHRLKEGLDRKVWEKLIIGCPDTTCHELEPQLHTYVKQRLLGRFNAEPTASNDEIRREASRIFEESLKNRRRELFLEVLDEARSNGRGALGLRRVLRALEQGEVQALLLGEQFAAHAVLCESCGHLDSHMSPTCAVCGKETRELEDVSDAILSTAIQRDIETLYVPSSAEFEKVGNIAALLRFRADQSKGAKLAS